MASSYSTNLKLELLADGEKSGLWGQITNLNLGTALEEAITGIVTVTFTTDADLTISLTNTNGSQPARNAALNLVSGVALTASRNLIVPTIRKPYIVVNATTGGQAIVVKTAAGSGISVPNGQRAYLYVDGTNVVSAISYFSTLMVGALNNTPIGATTPATGAFTTLSATGNVTLGDAGTDTTTINSQLSLNGSVGTTGQVAVSQGPNQSATWTTLNTNPTITDDNTNNTRYITFVDGLGTQALKVDLNTSPLGYNPSTNTISANISGNATTATSATSATTATSATSATTATNVAGGTASVTTLSATGNVTLGDAGTDTTTINSQLSLNGSVGTSGQVAVSQGPNQPPAWADKSGLVVLFDGAIPNTGSNVFDVPVSNLAQYREIHVSFNLVTHSSTSAALQFGFPNGTTFSQAYNGTTNAYTGFLVVTRDNSGATNTSIFTATGFVGNFTTGPFSGSATSFAGLSSVALSNTVLRTMLTNSASFTGGTMLIRGIL